MLKVAVPVGIDKHQHPTTKTYIVRGILSAPLAISWWFTGLALCTYNDHVLVIQKFATQGLEHGCM